MRGLVGAADAVTPHNTFPDSADPASMAAMPTMNVRMQFDWLSSQLAVYL
jgi:hypothetical protein